MTQTFLHTDFWDMVVTIKFAKNRCHKDLMIENKNNPAKIWNVVKSLFPSGKSSQSTLTNFTNRDNLLQKVNNFCQYFSCCTNRLKELCSLYKICDREYIIFLFAKEPKICLTLDKLVLCLSKKNLNRWRERKLPVLTISFQEFSKMLPEVLLSR